MEEEASILSIVFEDGGLQCFSSEEDLVTKLVCQESDGT
jgi:hypothetical protein